MTRFRLQVHCLWTQLCLSTFYLFLRESHFPSREFIWRWKVLHYRFLITAYSFDSVHRCTGYGPRYPARHLFISLGTPLPIQVLHTPLESTPLPLSNHCSLTQFCPPVHCL